MFVLCLMNPGFSFLNDLLWVVSRETSFLTEVGFLVIQAGPLSLTTIQTENRLLLPARQNDVIPVLKSIHYQYHYLFQSCTSRLFSLVDLLPTVRPTECLPQHSINRLKIVFWRHTEKLKYYPLGIYLYIPRRGYSRK